MEPIIEICDVKKEYRLGAIGGTTLNAELQSFLAKLRGKEDPNKKIGAREGKAGERFMALDGVSFSVQPGEAVGIIGHNGAGKSTLLKLISRVTAPSDGEIRLRGRVASMLEVGTGFHPELTGRENVYLNGAILGMTKAEIDKKFDEIVEFAEMRQFIDTPVKRYSSGMYVKLAFSVAAHLDSEIMIMDEVLAVGDANFQNKCLGKMSDEARNAGKAILYVSHNMGTIQRLCTRCIVLDHGKVIFDGDVDTAIGFYLQHGDRSGSCVDLTQLPRNQWVTQKVVMRTLTLKDRPNCVCLQNSGLDLELHWDTTPDADLHDLVLRVTLYHQSGIPAAFTTIGLGNRTGKTQNTSLLHIDLNGLVPGNYHLTLDMNQINPDGSDLWDDCCEHAVSITIEKHGHPAADGFTDNTHMIPWRHSSYGAVRLDSRLTEHTSTEG